MYDFNQLLELCEERIESLNRVKEPLALYDPIVYSMRGGGKRVRPIALLIAANIFNDDIEGAIYPALAVEVFHNFTLLHDDIMDKALTRRGEDCVHVKWGVNSAILSGDAMLILSYMLLSKAESQYVAPLLEVFNEITIGVCEGQQYDMDFETRCDVTLEEYLEMIRLKTSILIAGAMKMGAICGGASQESVDTLYEIGLMLGMAFQIQDDVLDTYGNSKNFGKRVGGDILEAKKTYLYLTTFKNATSDDRELLDKILHSEIKDEAKINGVKEIYDRYMAREIAAEAVESYFKKSIELIDSLKVEEGRKESIRALANFLLLRKK